MIKGHLYRGKERIDFSIPEQWNEITLEAFERIKEDSDELEIFSVLSNLDLELVKSCKAEEVSYIVEQLSRLFDYEALSDLKGVVEEVELNGRTYTITTELLGMKAGQWWDVKKVEQMYQDKPVEGIRHILSILMLEKDNEYDYSNVKQTYEDLAKLDVETAFKLRSFFLSSQVLYLLDSQRSSIKNTTLKNLKQVTIRLVVNMVVYLPSTVWHRIKRLLAPYLERKRR